MGRSIEYVRELFVYRFHFERISRRWAQRKLAKMTGIRTSTISAAERGRVNLRPDELEAMAAAFKIQPASVLAEKIGPSLFLGGQVIRTPEASEVE